MDNQYSHIDFKREVKKHISRMFKSYGFDFHYPDVIERRTIYCEILDFDPDIVEMAIKDACRENSESEFNRKNMPQAYHIENHCNRIYNARERRLPEVEKPQNFTPTNYAGELDKAFGKQEDKDGNND